VAAKPISKIMVYIDGSEESITAAQYALILSRATGSAVLAFYVVNTKALGDLVKARIFLEEEQMDYEMELRGDAERYLNHVRELATAKGIPVQTDSVAGSVYQEIVNRVKSDNIDLLIVGEISHIRSRRDEFFDEVDRAIRTVPCSVLIVKDDQRVWELYNELD
jgi:nucleotide-binding universal stress UspA family protein